MNTKLIEQPVGNKVFGAEFVNLAAVIAKKHGVEVAQKGKFTVELTGAKAEAAGQALVDAWNTAWAGFKVAKKGAPERTDLYKEGHKAIFARDLQLLRPELKKVAEPPRKRTPAPRKAKAAVEAPAPEVKDEVAEVVGEVA